MRMKKLTQNEMKFVSGGSSGQKGDDPQLQNKALVLAPVLQQEVVILPASFAQGNKDITP